MTRDRERRRSVRSAVAIGGHCRGGDGQRLLVVLTDLSPAGCCILVNRRMTIGQRVMLKPDSLAAIAARVKWMNTDMAGLSFEKPLYGPVCDHLARTYGSYVSEAELEAARCQLLADLAKAAAAEREPVSQVEEIYRSLPPYTPRPGLQARETSRRTLQLFLR